jgi:Fe-S-cluster containining protein
MTNSCNGCGLCCKLFYINLSREEYESGKFKTELGAFKKVDNFKMASECGANLLAKKLDGSCVYLVDNKCGIHADRPKACRNFFCTTKAKKFQGMVDKIKQSDKEKVSSIFD